MLNMNFPIVTLVIFFITWNQYVFRPNLMNQRAKCISLAILGEDKKLLPDTDLQKSMSETVEKKHISNESEKSNVKKRFRRNNAESKKGFRGINETFTLPGTIPLHNSTSSSESVSGIGVENRSDVSSPLYPVDLSTTVSPLAKLLQFTYPVNRPFCVLRKGSTTHSVVSYGVVRVTCYCDDVCSIFGDCCWPLDRYCRDIKPTVVSIEPNHTECWLQGTRDILDVHSKYYWVVKSCPQQWADAAVRAKCEFNGLSSKMDVLLPVSSKEHNITFKNIYCAACHGVVNFQAWTPKIVCEETQFETFVNATTSSGILEKVVSLPDCMVLFEPPERYPGRPCIGPGGSHDPVRGLEDNRCSFYAEQDLVTLCQTKPVSITYYQTLLGYGFGRNVFCWLCQASIAIGVEIQECDEHETNDLKIFDSPGFSAVIDFQKEMQCQENMHDKSCQQHSCQENDPGCLLPLTGLVNMQFIMTLKLTPKQSWQDWVVLFNDCISIRLFTTQSSLYIDPLHEWTYGYALGLPTGCGNPSFHGDYTLVRVPFKLAKPVPRIPDGLRWFERFEDRVSAYIEDIGSQLSIGNKPFDASVVSNRAFGNVSDAELTATSTSGNGTFVSSRGSALQVPWVLNLLVSLACLFPKLFP